LEDTYGEALGTKMWAQMTVDIPTETMVVCSSLRAWQAEQQAHRRQ
jgi:hypothetical protein